MVATLATLPPLYLIAGLLLLVFAILAARQGNSRSPEARALALLALVNSTGLAIQLSAQARWIRVSPQVSAKLPLYTCLLVIWVIGWYVVLYTRDDRRAGWGWFLALPPVAGVIAFDSQLTALPAVLWRGNGQVLPTVSVSRYAMLSLWVGLLSIATFISARQYAQTRRPLHRNRLIYLAPVLVLAAVSAALAFSRQESAGLAALVLAAALMANMASIHHLPDLRKIIRQTLAYLILTMVTGIVFAVGFVVAGWLLGGQTGTTSVWIGAVIAAGLAVGFTPVLNLIRGWVDRLLAGTTYHSALVVSDYTHQTSNVLDIELLAALATGYICETLEVTGGHLALVNLVDDGEQRGYRLTGVPITGKPDLLPGSLALHGPIADQLAHDEQPVTQYDLDFLPDYQSARSSELSWFRATGMDVYIPIIAHNVWIGLMMLGPKKSGDRYSAEDLILLSALASHTAVTLENARLVSHLEQLNQEIQSAYTTLDIAKRKLERLDKVKSDFISVVSHELRTPLTLLMGYSDILNTYQQEDSDSVTRQALAGIETGAERMHEIVESMLDVARIDNSMLDLHISRIDLLALTRSVQATLEPATQERRIQLTVIEESELPIIEGDTDALRKVIQHLASNAIKYTPDGGCVEIILRELGAGDGPLGIPSVEILVSDTGIGITPEMNDLIFTKFYQTGPVGLHSSGKTKFKGGGPGLGLAVVRGIAEAHNGMVWAESKGYDEVTCPGSHFHVVLPVAQTALAFTDRPTVPVETNHRL